MMSMVGKLIVMVLTMVNNHNSNSFTASIRTIEAVSIGPMLGTIRRKGTIIGLVTDTRNCDIGL